MNSATGQISGKCASMLSNAMCCTVHLGRNNLHHNYTMYGNDLEKTEKEKDIGVIISSNLKPTDQCEKAVRTATGVLHRILRSFSYRDRTVLPRIYKRM